VRWKIVTQVALRSLLIQGSWNYRNLLGVGVAWALLPFRREEARAAGEGEWIRRTSEPFNAHPYLSPAALAALIRIEEDPDADPLRIKAFREAIRSPLGGLGDGFFWGAWRPTCTLFAILMALLGAHPLWVMTFFLVTWNSVHLAIRLRSAVAGLEGGFRVPEGIRSLELPRWTERMGAVGVLLLGLAGGVLVARGMAGPAEPVLWIPLAVILLCVGLLGGAGMRRWIPGLAFLLVIAATWMQGP